MLYLAEGFALDTATGSTLATLRDPFDVLATALAAGDGRVAGVLDKRVADLYGLPGS